MTKQDFLFEFLLLYNKHESLAETDRLKMIKYWKKQDNDGLIFYAIRNLMCHHTEDSLNNIETYIKFETVLDRFNSLKFEKNERLKLIEFMLQTSGIEKILRDIKFVKYERVSTNNSYMFYIRDKNNLFYSIFFHNKAQFISCSLSTYDDKASQKIFVKDKYYIETEPYDYGIYFKFFNYDNNDTINPKLEFKFNSKKPYFRDFTEVSYCVMEDGVYVEYTELDKTQSKNTKTIEREELEKLIPNYFELNIIEKVVNETKNQYNEIDSILHKIGLTSSAILLKNTLFS